MEKSIISILASWFFFFSCAPNLIDFNAAQGIIGTVSIVGIVSSGGVTVVAESQTDGKSQYSAVTDGL